ncbi:hypothetical protein JHK86_004550 [Glycine max]|nr:hypothetical protein JHK86_004550 [Glycine max]
MRRFLVDRASIENVNVVQQEAELEPPPNVENREGTFSAKSAKRDPHGEKGYNVVSIGPKMMGQKKGMRNRMTSTKLRDYPNNYERIHRLKCLVE